MTMTIGDKIRIFRQMRNYTQEVMAEQLGLSQTGYAKIERNETDISMSRLEEIAKVLEVKAEDILGFHERNVFYANASSQQIGSIANNYFQSIAEGERVAIENERQQYRERIQHLEQEVVFLREMLSNLSKKG